MMYLEMLELLMKSLDFRDRTSYVISLNILFNFISNVNDKEINNTIIENDLFMLALSGFRKSSEFEIFIYNAKDMQTSFQSMDKELQDEFKLCLVSVLESISKLSLSAVMRRMVEIERVPTNSTSWRDERFARYKSTYAIFLDIQKFLEFDDFENIRMSYMEQLLK